jgi:hypothetical protein
VHRDGAWLPAPRLLRFGLFAKNILNSMGIAQLLKHGMAIAFAVMESGGLSGKLI